MFKKTRSSRTYNVSGRHNLDVVSKSRKNTETNKGKIVLNQQFYIELTSGLLDA